MNSTINSIAHWLTTDGSVHFSGAGFIGFILASSFLATILQLWWDKIKPKKTC